MLVRARVGAGGATSHWPGHRERRERVPAVIKRKTGDFLSVNQPKHFPEHRNIFFKWATLPRRDIYKQTSVCKRWLGTGKTSVFSPCNCWALPLFPCTGLLTVSRRRSWVGNRPIVHRVAGAAPLSPSDSAASPSGCLLHLEQTFCSSPPSIISLVPRPVPAAVLAPPLPPIPASTPGAACMSQHCQFLTKLREPRPDKHLIRAFLPQSTDNFSRQSEGVDGGVKKQQDEGRCWCS